MGSSWPTQQRSGWDPVNDFLVSSLEWIDPRLLEYLDEHHRLSPATLLRLQQCATAMLGGEISPGRLVKDWPDWFLLTPVFVAAHGTWELADLEAESGFRVRVEPGDGAVLTEADRNYLSALREALDQYSHT